VVLSRRDGVSVAMFVWEKLARTRQTIKSGDSLVHAVVDAASRTAVAQQGPGLG